MAANQYHFVDRWRVKGDVKEVADILEDAAGLTRWWRSVYFEFEELDPGGEHGIGKLIRVRAGGWLPYTLRINFRTIDSNYLTAFRWMRLEIWKGRAFGLLSRMVNMSTSLTTGPSTRTKG